MTAATFAQQQIRTVRFNYLRQAGPDRPTLLFLHGAGAKGDDLELVRTECLPKLVDGGLEIPFQLICPQCPAALPGWPIEDLVYFIRTLMESGEINSTLCVTGISMGGRGSWDLAYRVPDQLRAMVPLCGFSLPQLAPRLGKLPVWTWHGAKDTVVPVDRTEETVQALNAAGNPVRYTRMEDAGHNIGEFVYSQPDLWQWLENQTSN